MKNDVLFKNQIQAAVNDFFDIHIKESIDSTNNALKRNSKFINNGFVLIANNQTNGRGRNNNTFNSPSNNGIYLSIFLKPENNISSSLKLTAYTSLVVAKTIEQLYEIKPGIKWVNDIFINNHKVCGILCEASLNNNNIDYFIVGIGINLHSYTMPYDLQNIAGCIEDYSNKFISRNTFISTLLNNFYSLYSNLDNIIDEYKKYSCILNKEIEVIEPKETYYCKAIDIDNNGYLIIEKENKKFPLISGEIHVRQIHNK